jgi:hypothetical protein
MDMERAIQRVDADQIFLESFGFGGASGVRWTKTLSLAAEREPYDR